MACMSSPVRCSPMPPASGAPTRSTCDLPWFWAQGSEDRTGPSSVSGREQEWEQRSADDTPWHCFPFLRSAVLLLAFPQLSLSERSSVLRGLVNCSIAASTTKTKILLQCRKSCLNSFWYLVPSHSVASKSYFWCTRNYQFKFLLTYLKFQYLNNLVC